jgi:nucleotide-binding universal stress UspA family protein
LPDECEALIILAADVFLPPDSDAANDDFPNYVPDSLRRARQHARERFAETKTLAARTAERLAGMFPGWKVRTETVADTPHWAIIGKCEEWKPDLVVVGSHGRSAVGRLIFGSVAQKVLYEVEGSVRIAREHAPLNGRGVRLVLGADGSQDATEMVREVARRQWPPLSAVKLITSFESAHWDQTEPEVHFDRIRDLQNVAAEMLRTAGLEVETLVSGEDPKSVLVREAKKWDADCIFVGARGHSFLERVVVGSVSAAIAARAECSVEVVRPRKSGR